MPTSSMIFTTNMTLLLSRTRQPIGHLLRIGTSPSGTSRVTTARAARSPSTAARWREWETDANKRRAVDTVQFLGGGNRGARHRNVRPEGARPASRKPRETGLAGGGAAFDSGSCERDVVGAIVPGIVRDQRLAAHVLSPAGRPVLAEPWPPLHGRRAQRRVAGDTHPASAGALVGDVFPHGTSVPPANVPGSFERPGDAAAAHPATDAPADFACLDS